jgi:RNA polymerase sigma-70 factor, ECF subfamily
MSKMTDEELVLAIRDGDIASFEELVKRYQHGLFVFVMRFLRDEQASLDIVQESLVKIYTLIDKIDVNRKFSTFLFEIAKNSAISEFRKRKHSVSLEQIVDLENDETFMEQFLRLDAAQNVRRAVKKLPGKYQRVITLYYFDELSYEEVSKRLKVPVNTIRTHLKRAKVQLKKLLPYERY